MQPTSDYGTLGPGSDISATGVDPIQRTPRGTGMQPAHLVAIVAGILGALVWGAVSKGNPVWPEFDNFFSSHEGVPRSAKDSRQLDRLEPQKQAETLLEMAVAHSEGASEQISSRVNRWQGQVQWNSQIATLTTAALNSDDMRVRESGIEVELAAYGLAKNSASLEHVLKQVDSPDHAQKIWALWALGLMANRGVETERGVGVLIEHLSDADAASRQWAVEGLALAGSDSTIQPLLKVMHDDPSAVVRERAACGLAESGMFTPQQRFSAIPQLLAYTDDPSIDAQTHGWAFQALGDITHQRFGNDSTAWRAWYARQGE
ncbi:MAG: HEAT repeat domain-containing protein [Candidatus Sulfotelmatobacter sp.]